MLRRKSAVGRKLLSPPRMGVAMTIRDVPDDVRDELAARAARAGTSLQVYLRGMLIDSVAPARARRDRSGPGASDRDRVRVDAASMMAARHADRR